MLVEHIVFLKLTRPLTEDEHKRVLTPLGRISGMLSMSCGSTYSERGMGFNFCIKITFASKEDEIAFRTHPLHAQLRAEIIQPLIDTDAPAPTMTTSKSGTPKKSDRSLEALPASASAMNVASLRYQ